MLRLRSRHDGQRMDGRRGKWFGRGLMCCVFLSPSHLALGNNICAACRRTYLPAQTRGASLPAPTSGPPSANGRHVLRPGQRGGRGKLSRRSTSARSNWAFRSPRTASKGWGRRPRRLISPRDGGKKVGEKAKLAGAKSIGEYRFLGRALARCVESVLSRSAPMDYSCDEGRRTKNWDALKNPEGDYHPQIASRADRAAPLPFGRRTTARSPLRPTSGRKWTRLTKALPGLVLKAFGCRSDRRTLARAMGLSGGGFVRSTMAQWNQIAHAAAPRC